MRSGYRIKWGESLFENADCLENPAVGMSGIGQSRRVRLYRRRPLGPLPGASGAADESGSCLLGDEPLESSRVLARHPDHADLRRCADAALRLRAVLVFAAAHPSAGQNILNGLHGAVF